MTFPCAWIVEFDRTAVAPLLRGTGSGEFQFFLQVFKRTTHLLSNTRTGRSPTSAQAAIKSHQRRDLLLTKSLDSFHHFLRLWH